MIHEYTKNKDIAIKKLSRSYQSLKFVLVVVSVFSFYIMLALVSFNPFDPSWLQTTGYGAIHNWGGKLGAWLADTLFFAFGLLAYALPPITLFFCWNIFIQCDKDNYLDLLNFSLQLVGILALLLTSCSLAALNIDDLFYFTSGGIIGSLLSNAILLWFDGVEATLVLLSVWASGFTLFTGWMFCYR